MTIYEETPEGIAATGPATGPAAGTPVAGLPSDNPSAPYWLHDPSPLLLGHRSTPDLPAEVDVVVVGSGITGSFAADALLEAQNPGGDSISGTGGNRTILLLEAREACFGATGRNGGHCQPMVYSSAPAVAEFELATFHFLERFAAEHRVPCDWRTLPGGGVHAYMDADLFALAVELVEVLRTRRPDLAAHVTVVRPDDADATTDAAADADPTGTTTAAATGETPTLDSLRLRGAAGAVVQRHAASVWPYKLVAWVLERLVKTRGAAFNLQTNTPVLRVVKYDGSDDGDTSGAANTRWLVDTPRGQVKARAVLLATNGYTSHLLPPNLADLIVPVRGQVAALVPPAGWTKVEETREEAVVTRNAGNNVTASSSSSSSSSSGGVSRSSVTVTKTANGRTTKTTTATTKSNAPADRLSRSYVFIGHDHGLPGGGGDCSRDEYLVQRPFTIAAPGDRSDRMTAASSAGPNTDFSAFASSSSYTSSFKSSPPSGGYYIWGGGRQRAAGGGVGEWRDDYVEPPVARYLRTHLAPDLDVGGSGDDNGGGEPAPLKADYEWTGIMGYSRDQHPWVGRVPASAFDGGSVDGSVNDSVTVPSGLYLCAGFTGHGMPSTSLCGRVVAGMIKRDLGWETSLSAEEEARASTGVDGGYAELPRCFLLTPERIREARATCPPVAEADARGFLAELQQLLAERRAGR